jgi:hypothetical protein
VPPAGEQLYVNAGDGQNRVTFAHWSGQEEDSALNVSAITILAFELGCLLM